MTITTNDVFGLYWTFAVIEIVIVFTRMWLRRKVTKGKIDASDIFILLGLLFALTGCSANTWVLLVVGKFTDISNGIDLDLIERYLKVAFATGFCYYGCLYSIKGAFLALYFKLFQKMTRNIRISVYLVAGYVGSAFLVTICQNMFICMPISRNWNFMDFCTAFQRPEAFITATALNISSDILIMLLPLLILKSLKLQRGELFAIGFIIALGSIAIVASIIRFIAIWTVSRGNLSSWDANRQTLIITFWSGLELGLVIVAVCLPAFRSWWNFLILKAQKRSYLNTFNYMKKTPDGKRGASKPSRGNTNETDTLASFELNLNDPSGLGGDKAGQMV